MPLTDRHPFDRGRRIYDLLRSDLALERVAGARERDRLMEDLVQAGGLRLMNVLADAAIALDAAHVRRGRRGLA